MNECLLFYQVDSAAFTPIVFLEEGERLLLSGFEEAGRGHKRACQLPSSPLVLLLQLLLLLLTNYY